MPKPNSANITENSEALQNGNLLSVRDVSKLTGYHRDHVTFLARSGKLKAIKLGSAWVFKRDDVESFAQQNLGQFPESPSQPVEVKTEQPNVAQLAALAPVSPADEIKKTKLSNLRSEVLTHRAVAPLANQLQEFSDKLNSTLSALAPQAIEPVKGAAQSLENNFKPTISVVPDNSQTPDLIAPPKPIVAQLDLEKIYSSFSRTFATPKSLAALIIVSALAIGAGLFYSHQSIQKTLTNISDHPAVVVDVTPGEKGGEQNNSVANNSVAGSGNSSGSSANKIAMGAAPHASQISSGQKIVYLQGPPGVAGPQGPAGVPGANGNNGTNGITTTTPGSYAPGSGVIYSPIVEAPAVPQVSSASELSAQNFTSDTATIRQLTVNGDFIQSGAQNFVVGASNISLTGTNILLSGNITLSGSITTAGTLTSLSHTTPQLEIGYDTTDQWETATTSTGATTFTFAGTSPSATFTPSVDTTTAFNFTKANGTGVLTIDTQNGRVGINNSTPGYALDVTGSGNLTGNLTANGSASFATTPASTVAIGNTTGSSSITGSTVTVGSNSADLTLQTTTSGNINLVPVGSINLNGSSILAANKSLTALAGTGSFDFSNATGIFKTSTGQNTIGGNLAVNGSAINLNGANPVIDTTTGGSTLSINTVNNAPVTFGTGTVTIPNLVVTTSQSNAGIESINSTATTATVFGITAPDLTSGTGLQGTITANAGNGQTTKGFEIDLTDNTSGGGGYSAFTINTTGSGVGSGNKTIFDLNPGSNKEVVFDSTGALRPTTSAASNTNSIGSPSFYWKNGYFDTVNANSIAGTVVSGSTSSDTWTLGSTETGDVNEAVVFQRNSGSGNALLQWNAGAGDLRYLSTNYPLNSTYTVTDTSIGTNVDLFSGQLTNNASSGTQRLLSLTNTGTGTTADGIYVNNTGTGTTALEIAGTWTNGIITNGNSIATNNGTINAGNGTISTTGTGNISTVNSTTGNITNGNITNLVVSGSTTQTGSMSVLTTTMPQLTIGYDTSDKWASATTSAGATTFTFTGSVPSALFKLSADSTTAFNFTKSDGTTSVLDVDTQNGRVGIGTNSPAQKLDVNGAIAQGGTTIVDASHNLTNIGTITSGLINGQTISNAANFTGTAAIATSATTPIVYGGTGASSTLTLNGTSNGSPSNAYVLLNPAGQGNVGIGTTNPVYGELSTMGTDNTALSSSLWGTSTGAGVVNAIYNNSTTTNSVAGLRLITRSSGAYIWNIYNVSTGTNTGDLAFGGGTSGTGSEAMRITSAGNVGIGTTAPANKLQIGSMGGTGYGGNAFAVGDGTNIVAINYGSTAYLTSTGNTVIGGNGNTTNQLVAANNGNVGIGTTSPAQKLDVNGAIAQGGTTIVDASHNLTNIGTITSGLINGQTVSSAANFTGTLAVAGTITSTLGSGVVLNDISGGTNALSVSLGNSNNTSYFGQESNTAGGFFTGSLANSTVIYSSAKPIQEIIAGTPVITTLANGNVGIGTTSPGAALQINAPDYTTKPALSFRQSNSGADGYDFNLDQNVNGNLYLKGTTLSTPIMTWQRSNGDVGIGTTSPDQKLVINGSTGFGTPGSESGYIQPNGSTDFRVFANTGDALNLGANGTVGQLYVSTAGNVGVGTTSPTQPLTIQGDEGTGITNDQLRIQSNVSGHTAGIHFTDNVTSDGFIDFIPSATAASRYISLDAGSGSSALVVNGSGNVGVGTTAPAANGVGGTPTVLQIANSGSSVGELQLSNTSTANGNAPGVVDFDSTGLSGSDKRLAEIAAIKGDALTVNPVGSLVFDVSNGGSPSEAMRVLYNGNVGIGDTNPSNGTLTINGNAGDGQIRLENTGHTSDIAGIGVSGGSNAIINGDVAGDLSIFSNGAKINFSANTGTNDQMVLLANGNVGIGTTTPAYNLTVQNTATAGTFISNFVNGNDEGLYIAHTGSSSNFSGYGDPTNTVVVAADYNGGGSYRPLAFATGGAGRVIINTSGNVGIGTTTTNYRLNVTTSGPAGFQLTTTGATLGAPQTDLYDTTNGVEMEMTANAGAGWMGTYSANDLNIMTQQTSRIFVQNSSGNVGIGTTGPDSLLGVSGSNKRISITSTADSSEMLFGQWDGTNNRIESDNRPLLITSYTGSVSLGPSGAGDLVVHSTGDTSIQTNTDDAALTVGGSIQLTGGTRYVLLGNSQGMEDDGAANLELMTPGATNINFDPDNSFAMTILHGGNVGIGTTSPGTRLSVQDSAGSGDVLSLINSGTSTGQYVGLNLQIASGALTYGAIRSYIDTAGLSHTSILTGDNAGNALSQKLTVTSQGRVGIGTTTPNAVLDVAGDIIGEENYNTGQQIVPSGSPEDSLYFTTTHAGGGGNNYTYYTFSQPSYVIASGDYLEYDIYCSTSNPVCDAGIDLDLSSSDFLRSHGGYDQNGISTQGSIAAYASGRWYHRKISLASMVGETINNAEVEEESDTAGTYVNYYRNIEVTNGSVVHRTLWNGGAPSVSGIDYASSASNYSIGGSYFAGGYFAGNVGIGTTSPVWQLEVNKNTTAGSTGQYPAVSVNNPNAAGFGGFYFYKGVTQMGGMDMANSNDLLNIYNSNGGNIELQQSGGNVGIGNTGPSNTLTVGATNCQSNALLCVRSGGSGGGNSIEFGHGNTSGYASTIGDQATNGDPFIAFDAEAGTTGNTYKTRGISGTVLRGDLSGGLNVITIPNGNADNQSGSTILSLDSSGDLGATGAVNFNGDIAGNGKTVLETGDAYLRINQGNQFSNGIWVGPSNIDMYTGALQVGSQGGAGEVKISGSAGDATNRITINGDSGANSWFNTGGNVGIGTTNATYPLTLNNSSGETGIYTTDSGTGIYISHGGWGMGPGKLGIGNGSVPTLVVNSIANGGSSAGDVGIGTTSPGYPLEVDGPSSGAITFLTNGIADILNQAVVGPGGLFSNSNSTALNLGYGANQVMTIATSGEVGIGQTSPGALLDVNGDALIHGLTVGEGGTSSSTNTAFGAGAVGANNSSNTHNTGIGDNALHNVIAPGGATDNTAVGYDAYGGNSGANTGNTAIGSEAMLAVAGLGSSGISQNTAIGYAALPNLNGATTNNNIAIGALAGQALFSGTGNVIIGSNNGSTISGGTNNILIADGSGNIRISSNGAGQISIPFLASCGGIQTNGSGTMSCTSDERLKDIHNTFDDGLDSIMQIVPQTYSWKVDSGLYDGGILYSGFIAQNIQGAIPEAVNTNAQGYLQINTTTILATTVNAIKDVNLNLEAVAGTATPAPGSESESYMNAFFANMENVMTTWLADAGNGIQNIFAAKATLGQLCLQDANGTSCYTRSQMKTLADHAEDMPFLGSLVPGDVVEQSTTPNPNGNGLYNKFYVEQATTPYADNIIGVVSSATDISQTTTMPIALAGYVPVNITDENGPVHLGDYLTASASIPGYAMKATTSGKVIGQVLVEPDPTTAVTQIVNGMTIHTNSVLTFVNLGYENINNTLVLGQDLTVAQSVAQSTTQTGTLGSVDSALTYVIRQAANKTVVNPDGTTTTSPVMSDILQLQSGNITRLMVAYNGATEINAQVAPTDANGNPQNVFVVANNNANAFTIDASGNVLAYGTFVVKKDIAALGEVLGSTGILARNAEVVAGGGSSANVAAGTTVIPGISSADAATDNGEIKQGDLVMLKGADSLMLGSNPILSVVRAIGDPSTIANVTVIGIADRNLSDFNIPGSPTSVSTDKTKIPEGEYMDVVTSGTFADLNVDATSAPIAVGDKLTLSDTPGYARKLNEQTDIGMPVVGIALDAVPSGTGTVRVYLTLGDISQIIANQNSNSDSNSSGSSSSTGSSSSDSSGSSSSDGSSVSDGSSSSDSSGSDSDSSSSSGSTGSDLGSSSNGDGSSSDNSSDGSGTDSGTTGSGATGSDSGTTTP